MEDARSVAILLNNIGVELLLLHSNHHHHQDHLQKNIMNAVKTFQDAMELMKLVAMNRAPPPDWNGRQVLEAAQARRWNCNCSQRCDCDPTSSSDDHYNNNTFRFVDDMIMTPIVIQEDPHNDVYSCPTSIASCIMVFNYGMALERIEADDTAVYRIFTLASSLFETTTTPPTNSSCSTMNHNTVRTTHFLNLCIVGKLMQVSQRLGLLREHVEYRHSFIGLWNKRDQAGALLIVDWTIAPAA
jgi:hypothetical protein